MRIIVSLFLLSLSFASLGNFGGYQRHSTRGGGTILNATSNQLIELIREDIQIDLDQRVNFRARFWLKNTSDSRQTVTLAFPQFSFWDVPFSKGGYQPGDYVELNESFKINGLQMTFEEELYSAEFDNYSSLALKDRDAFVRELRAYAEVNEVGTPSMPFVIWKLKEVSFEPGETQELDISFARPWFYEDPIYTTGPKSNGKRFFDYIFETARTWKGGRIKEFELTINYPEESQRYLNFGKGQWRPAGPGQLKSERKNWQPSSSENLHLEWQSKLLLTAPETRVCFPMMYYGDYSWRFASDGTSKTAWCITEDALACSKLEVRSFDPRTPKDQYGMLDRGSESKRQVTKVSFVNGFAKNERLAIENGKPKIIVLNYRGVDGKFYKQRIVLKNDTSLQTFDLMGKTTLSNPFTLSIEDFFPGTKHRDICLAEISFQ